MELHPLCSALKWSGLDPSTLTCDLGLFVDASRKFFVRQSLFVFEAISWCRLSNALSEWATTRHLLPIKIHQHRWETYPANVPMNKLSAWLGLTLHRRTLRFSVSSVPLWLLNHPRINLSLHFILWRKSLDGISEISADYNHFRRLYTSGSKMRNRVASAVVCHSVITLPELFAYQIMPRHLHSWTVCKLCNHTHRPFFSKFSTSILCDFKLEQILYIKSLKTVGSRNCLC